MVRRCLLLAAAALSFACGREAPVAERPPQTTTNAPVTNTTATAPQTATAPSAPTTYRGAAQWYASTRGFHFTMRGPGFDVEGDMARTSIGAERVRFTHAGAEWVGAAERTGVIWYRRDGAKWTKAAPPPFADYVYQRATIWVDPQKREGEAQPSGSRAYTFTDANSGDRYEIAVDAQGRIEKAKISGSRPLAMTITRADESVNVGPTNGSTGK